MTDPVPRHTLCVDSIELYSEDNNHEVGLLCRQKNFLAFIKSWLFIKTIPAVKVKL